MAPVGNINRERGRNEADDIVLLRLPSPSQEAPTNNVSGRVLEKVERALWVI
jgi:hypothetical protein